MPTVYIAARNSGPAIPIFKKKGIPDSMPGVAAEIPVIVQAPFYSTPSRFFKYIIACLMTHLPVFTSETLALNAFQGITQLTRLFEVPACTFRFSKLSPAEITELKAMGLQQDLTNANLFVGTPASHLLKRITELGPIEDRIRPGHLSYDGFYAWVFLMKGIQLYTSTKNAISANAFNILSAGHVSPATTGSATAYDNSTVQYKNEHMTMEIANFCGDMLVLPAKERFSGFTGSFVDVGAMPSFADKRAIFFPFFIGMAVMDKMTCSEVFRSLFSGSLSAASKEADARILGKVRAGCRQLAFSRTGMVMSHVYKVFSLAEEVRGGKVHVVTKGSVYVGMIVEGDFSVSLYGRTTESGDITEDLGKINLMDSQAAEVAQLLNSAVDENGHAVYTFQTTDFLHSRRALSCWFSVDRSNFASSTNMDKAKHILEVMEFNDTFPVPSVSNISDAVNYIETGDRSILDKYPAYLDGGMLNASSRVWEALSIFGPKVPTCNTGDNKGTMINFPRAGASDANTVRVEGVRPLHYFPFWVVPLGVGANQWTSMFSKGILSVPKGRKGKKEFTDLHRVQLQIGAEPTFTTIYNSIKTVVNDYRRNAEGQGKRKRSGDDDEDRKGKKSRGQDVDDL
jgi:hypothetical protein